MSSVTIDDVRKFMKNLPEEFVGPDSIEMQIDFAEWICDKEASAAATAKDRKMFVIVHAAYYTTLAYMEEAERALGVIPPNLESLARNLENMMVLALGYIRRGDPVTLKFYGVSESVWDYRNSDIGESTSTRYQTVYEE